MTVPRRAMIDTLAGAATGGPYSASLTPDFDYHAARREFSKLGDDELNARYAALTALDASADGTDYEVVIVGEDCHFQIG